MLRETNVYTGYPIFIPLGVAFVQFCHLLKHCIFMEGNKCTDAGLMDADPMDADTTEGGDTDVILQC